MKTLLLAVLFTFPALSQAVTLTASPSTIPVRPGSTTTITLSLSGTPQVAGIQWTLTPPTNWTLGTQTATPAVTSIPKTLTCGSGSPPSTCFLWGFNVLPLPTGPIATVPVTVPSNAAPGPFTVALTGLFAGSPAGAAVGMNGVNAVVTVLSNFDINGDGSVTAADVNLIVAQVASGTCANDVVGNGQCSVLQVIAEVLEWARQGSKP